MIKDIDSIVLLGDSTKDHGNYNHRYKSYLLPCCGSIADFRPGRVAENSIECTNCFEKEVNDMFKTKGMTVIDYPIDFTNKTRGARFIKFDSCGHLKEVQLVHLRETNFKCKECQELKHKDKASIQGLTMLGSSNNKNKSYRSYRLPCGCTTDLLVTHAERGSWICRECNITYTKRPSSVYLYEFNYNGFTWLKLGHSSDKCRRLKGYGLKDGTAVSLIYLLNTSTGKEANNTENELHMFLKDHNIRSSIMREYMTTSGYTECYPVETKDLILRLLNDASNKCTQNTA